MKHALISMRELRESGYRVAQVEPSHNIFPVSEGLFWFPCEEDVVADQFWYDPATSTLIKIEVTTEDQESQ